MDGTEKKNNGEHDVFPAHFGACVDGSGAVTTYKEVLSLTRTKYHETHK